MKKALIGSLSIIFFIMAPRALAQPAPAKEPAGNPTIVFLLFKMTKDSLTGTDHLQLVEKIKSPGQIKKTGTGAAGLTRLPYLSLVFYQGKTALDSVRYGYPLRERIQNTRENAQGYKDIEIRSMEFFFRFQQNKADGLEIFEVGKTDKKKLLAIDLR
ncbi:MAG: hypothetical protein INR73_02040 [Williamsia sp.]|nr:hypothetical protein [Williamsia sp.]